MMDVQAPGRWRAVAVIAALALTVAACDVFSGEETDDGAVADQEDADEEGGDADDGDGDADDGDAEDGVGEPAEPRVWEVEEAVRQDGLEVVVERIVAEEFHTEVELRAVNTTGDETVKLVRGVLDETRLFDDRDRRFVYQHPAGLDDFDWIEVGAGERLEVTLVFRGAVQPDAELLTFQLAPDLRDQLSWEVPVDAGGDQ